MARNARVLAIRVVVRRREYRFRLKVAALLAFGALLLLAVPAVLGTVLWMIATYALARVMIPAWWWFSAPLAVLMVPLLLRLEKGTRGEYLSEVFGEHIPIGPTGIPLLPGPSEAVTAVALTAANPRLASGGVLDLALIGPRLVLSAVQQWRVAWHLRRVDRTRAAEFLDALNKRNQGMDTLKLLRPREYLGGMAPTLAFLAFHGWIGIGRKWEHIWLHSSERDVLRRAVRRPVQPADQ